MATKRLLQLVVWTYILHHASALECYTCVYIPGLYEKCSCNTSPEKGCDGIPQARSSGVSAKALPVLEVVSDFLSQGNTTNGRSDEPEVCALFEYFALGYRCVMRRLFPENTSQIQVEGKVPTSDSCKLQNINVVTYTKDGQKAEFKKACFCNTDYCNGDYIPDTSNPGPSPPGPPHYGPPPPGPPHYGPPPPSPDYNSFNSGSISVHVHYPGLLKEIRWSGISLTLLVLSICLVLKQ